MVNVLYKSELKLKKGRPVEKGTEKWMPGDENDSVRTMLFFQPQLVEVLSPVFQGLDATEVVKLFQ